MKKLLTKKELQKRLAVNNSLRANIGEQLDMHISQLLTLEGADSSEAYYLMRDINDTIKDLYQMDLTDYDWED